MKPKTKMKLILHWSVVSDVMKMFHFHGFIHGTDSESSWLCETMDLGEQGITFYSMQRISYA